MKKLLALTLSAVFMVSLVACGSGDTETPEELSVGDTITTDIMEFTLTRVEFADRLKYAQFVSGQTPDQEYLLPIDEPQTNTSYTFEADDGYKLLSYSYTLNYTGKEEIEVETAMGISAVYDDGYTFEIATDAYLWSDFISIDGTTILHPLDPQGEGRGYMKVPSEVESNTAAPLKITVSIPNGDGSTVDAVYTIR
mgnify:FL=1